MENVSIKVKPSSINVFALSLREHFTRGITYFDQFTLISIYFRMHLKRRREKQQLQTTTPPPSTKAATENTKVSK